MNAKDLSILLLLSLIWGASFLFMRMVVPEIGMVETVFFRLFFGVVALTMALLWQRKAWVFHGRLLPVMLLGITNSAIPFFCYGWAAHVLPSGYLAIFNALTPLMSTLIGYLAFKEALSLRSLGGILLGLSGVFILVQAGPVQFDHAALIGMLCCVLATICYGLSGFLIQRLNAACKRDTGETIDSGLFAVASLGGATIMALPILLIQIATTGLIMPQQTSHWIALLGLGFACTGVAYLFYFMLIARIGPMRTTLVALLIPCFGVVLGALILHETLSLAHLIGGALIGFALTLVLKLGQTAPAPAAKETA